MNERTKRRIFTLFTVTLLAMLATYGAFASAETSTSVGVQKSIVGNVTTAQPGDVITYRVRILNNTGSAQRLLMTDTLPADVELIGRPSLSVVAGSAPTNTRRDIRNKTLGFVGNYGNGTGVEMLFPVQVGLCYDTNNKTVTNEAIVTDANGAAQTSDSVSFTLNCAGTTSLNDLTWTAEMVDEPTDGSRMVDLKAYRGRFVRMFFQNNGAETLKFDLKMPTTEYRVTLGWSGCLTCVRSADTAHYETVAGRDYSLSVAPNDTYFMEFYVETSDESSPSRSDQPVYWHICLDQPAGEPICLPDDDVPGRGQSRSLLYFFARRDLGDAPDSTNHAGAPMTAYTGIAANFPTVHNAALGTPQGPVHFNSGSFHLGNGVSVEVEADIGPDTDPANNIEAAANTANLDGADDGVRPNAWAFTDCTSTTIPVRVFIHPNAVTAFGTNPGYINIWVDANRDGDWADVANCSGTASPEHIVIDAPVDIATLGAGIHTVNVPTGLVRWPSASADDPSWARVMLTGVPSVKLSGEDYGDGRGRALPYASGETEDYLLKPEQKLNVDLLGNYGPVEEGQQLINWRVRFGNQSDMDVANFTLDIDLPDQSAINLRSSNDALSCVPTASGVSCSAASLPSGASGTVSVQTALLATSITEVTATVNGDGTTSQSDTESLIVDIQSLVAEYYNGMDSGEELINTFVVRVDTSGLRSTAAAVDFLWDGILIDSVTPDSVGRAELTELITRALKTPGEHILTARMGDQEVHRTITVDPTIGFSPVSMRLTDKHGNTFAPFDEFGRTDTNGWRIVSELTEPLTATIHSNAVSMLIRYEDGTEVPMVVPDGEVCVFTAQLMPPSSRANTAQKIFIEATDADGVVTVAEGIWIVVEGIVEVVNAKDGSPIENVELLQRVRPANGKWTQAQWVESGPRTKGNFSDWLDLFGRIIKSDSSLANLQVARDSGY